ncbi:MAG: rod-binding protein [Thiomicrospira sp.]|uniref:rod-binding protein n=1 Tax=Thiomicrospira sp. TaxID=935 RepID=UPI001A03ABF6|nr:rod-binding protein [Thiomicrospira sp.]MBE0494049.1 rod-binding protein [Thiomicrospira sp.]
MSSISDLTSARPQDHTIYTNVGALNDLKRQAREDQQSVLRPIAQQFEAMFLEQILKNSRSVKLDDGWLDGSQADSYLDMYDKQLAQDMSAKGSLGFADQIVEQLSASLPKLDDEQQQKWLEQQQKRFDSLPTKAASSTQDALALRNLE